MITLLTTIPTLAFPCELDTLTFKADGDEYDVDIAISVGQQTVLETSLIFDTDGQAVLDDMATLLSDHLETLSAFTVSYATTKASGYLIPCRLQMEETAAEFVTKSFLTTLQGTKITTLASKEFLSIYATSKETGTVTAHYLDEDDTLVTLTHSISHDTNTANIYTYDVSSALFETAEKTKLRLFMYSVKIGERTQNFHVWQDMPGEQGVLFYNAFGCLESFLFVEVEKVAKPTRHAAVISGIYRNYMAVEGTTYKGISRPLSEGEAMLADDLAHALRVWTQGSETELAITDNELKVLSSWDELPRLSLTWRNASSRTRFVPVRPVRTFDFTFDSTFF